VALSKAPEILDHPRRATSTPAQFLLSMLIIDENKRDLRNFFDGNRAGIVGPVIRTKPRPIGQPPCSEYLKEFEKNLYASCNIADGSS
jgi:hypothetical protein